MLSLRKDAQFTLLEMVSVESYPPLSSLWNREDSPLFALQVLIRRKAYASYFWPLNFLVCNSLQCLRHGRVNPVHSRLLPLRQFGKVPLMPSRAACQTKYSPM